MRRVLFLSPFAHQSAYWANQLGFAGHEWQHINRPEHVRGRRAEGTTVYICGMWYESEFVQDALDYFEVAGIECIMAEEMVPVP